MPAVRAAGGRDTGDSCGRAARDLRRSPHHTRQNQLEIPRLAENGNIVPVAITVDSPMTEQDYVESIHLFAERNPLPRVLEAELGPRNGRARIATRIRLAVSQQVLAVAIMSDGTLWSTAADVEVTVGGCDP